MRVDLTKEEAEYLMDKPFWDWKKAELDVYTTRILTGDKKGRPAQSLIRRERFYYDLYKKLGGELEREKTENE